MASFTHILHTERIAEGPSIAQAREKVYREVAKIDCDNLFYRHDIAHCAFE